MTRSRGPRRKQDVTVYFGEDGTRYEDRKPAPKTGHPTDVVPRGDRLAVVTCGVCAGVIALVTRPAGHAPALVHVAGGTSWAPMALVLPDGTLNHALTSRDGDAWRVGALGSPRDRIGIPCSTCRTDRTLVAADLPALDARHPRGVVARPTDNAGTL